MAGDTSVLVLEPGAPTAEIDAELIAATGPQAAKPLRRERLQIGGAALAEIARVKNAAPAAADYGLVTRTLLYDAAGNPLVVAGGKLAVDGSGVTQPVSGSVAVSNFPGTQPVSAAALPLPAGASTEATLALIKAKTDNLDVLLSTRTKPADTQPVSLAAAVDVSDRAARALGQVVGDVASGVADAGNPVKTGGLAKTALPPAVADGQRVSRLHDLYGRQRVLIERPKLLGSYKFESGRLTVLAAAHASTAGFFWLINPIGSSVVAYVKKLFATSVPTAVTAFPSSPRVTVERVTFTGTASGATITPAKRDSTDAANVCTVRTASTGLTLTAGAIVADFTVAAVLTGVGIAVPVDQWFYDAADDDDLVVLRAGEGLVFRQADAGTAADTRLVLIFGSWEER